MNQLNPTEKEEYNSLLKTFKSAGGNPQNPLEDTTLRIFRGEAPNKPERSITPNEVDRLRTLFRKKLGEINPE